MAHGPARTLTNRDDDLPRRRVSFEEFHDWLDEDTRAEWVDGEIILMSPSNLDHQFILGFLHHLLAAFVARHPLGVLLLPPFLMRLRWRPSGREPDLLFVANEHRDRLRHTYLDGPADIVVEIVSPDSEQRDREEKLAEYERAGVAEYWLVDPLLTSVRMFVLDTSGRYREQKLESGALHSSVLPGFRLRPDWLWQQPLPDVNEALRSMGE